MTVILEAAWVWGDEISVCLSLPQDTVRASWHPTAEEVGTGKVDPWDPEGFPWFGKNLSLTGQAGTQSPSQTPQCPYLMAFLSCPHSV